MKIVGTIIQPVEDDRPFGYRLFVDDGSGEVQVFIATTTGINAFEVPFLQPGWRVRVIGFSGEFTDPQNPAAGHHEINPRFPEDIKPADGRIKDRNFKRTFSR
ncbi:MAG: hypothetical protein ACREYF_03480 [Gammaproteobacteria bacterium]